MSEGPVLPADQELFKLNEVCKLANVQPYMLRYWGTEFPQLDASKSGTGQRLYSRAQVELILEVRRLLFDEGLTIAGARKKIAPLTESMEIPQNEDLPEEVRPARRSGKPRSRRTKGARQVDKDEGERVQRLLLLLREVRDEISGVLSRIEGAE
ncbi:MAG: MerR family transcriptional regulator [Acidobacteria bacterium]|nr:MerR family transcriptional regulator [Acidobacteriota bacterium]